MLVLVIGVALWGLTHLFPAALPDARTRLAQKLGENTFRGLFSLVIIGSLIIIFFGWRSATPGTLYAPPLSAGLVPSFLMLASFVLFFASGLPGNIKRYVRHPQMMATIVWGVTHLLTNGSLRAVVLFGGLAAWAVAEILLINRRDGSWQRPVPGAAGVDAINIVLGTLVFSAVLYFHKAIFGVPATAGF